MSSADTLPLRPPPRVPRHTRDDEELFVSIDSVRRDDTLSDGKYSNTHLINVAPSVNGKGLEDDESSSETSDTDSDFEDALGVHGTLSHKNGTLTQGKVDLMKDWKGDNAENKGGNASTFPAGPFPGMHRDSEDTSEDSDFIAASFWLRNKRDTDTFDPDDLPPAVSERFDSLGNPGPPARRCVSLNLETHMDSHSPTLEILGDAPKPHDLNETSDLSLYDFPKPTPQKSDLSHSSDDIYKVPPRRQRVAVLPRGQADPNPGSQKPQGVEDWGEYELLARCREGKLVDIDDPSPSSCVGPLIDFSEPEPVSSVNNELANEGEADDLYGATWLCNSAKPAPAIEQVEEQMKPRRKTSDKEPFVPCRLQEPLSSRQEFEPGEKPEKLIVNMTDSENRQPPSKTEKSTDGYEVPMRPHSHKTKDNSKHISIGKMLKKLTRKSDSPDLPESLTVDLSTMGEHHQTGCGAAGMREEGNLYTDFPDHDRRSGACAAGSSPALESDILKLALEQDQPFCPKDRPPLDLPKRDFGELRSAPKKAALCLDNEYEDVVANKAAVRSLPQPPAGSPVPSPPTKPRGHKLVTQGSATEDEPPLAPPRRSKKPSNTLNSTTNNATKMTSLGTCNLGKSVDSSSYGLEKFRSSPSPPSPPPPRRPPAKGEDSGRTAPPRPDPPPTVPIRSRPPTIGMY